MKRMIALLMVLVAGNAHAYMGEGYVRKLGAQLLGGVNTYTPDNSLRNTEAHGRYYDPLSQGNIYTANAKSVTVLATADIAPLPVTTGSGILDLYNPAGSNKNLSILWAGCSEVSGTPGGPLYFDILPPSPSYTVNASLVVASSNVIVNGANWAMASSTAKVFIHPSLGNSVAFTTLRPLCGPGAAAVTGAISSCESEIDGAINVPPGGILAISAHAAGTTHITSCYITWEEIPL